jgi:membrane-bound acyltransferase YfiQ involved in biofilm formation
MLAAIAGVIFIIAACVGWIDKTVSTNHLLAISFVAMVFLCAHLVRRLYAPDGRHW